VIDTTLARRYAQALVEIGEERNALDGYGRDLTALTELVAASKDFREVLINPVFPKDDKKKIANSILEKLGTDRMVINFINLLIDRKRIDQLEGIEKAYHQLVDEIRGITRGEVASASPLDDAELDRIRKALSDISGKEVRLSARVDPSLIGGLVAKVGDKVFDGSIRSQLNELKESLRG
jgi:F-type H+-transporting ATPase subunit delta